MMRQDIRDAETVRRAKRDAVEYLMHSVSILLDDWLDDACTGLRDWLADERPAVESPIEAIFGLWWQALRADRRLYEFSDLALEPQHELVFGERRYRLDFVVTVEDPDELFLNVKYDLGVAKPLVAVELDGHEFHERTKAQVASRNTRDADLQMAGWTVFHFSGSEVVRDPLTCAQRVFDFAGGQFSAFRRAVRVELRRRGIAD